MSIFDASEIFVPKYLKLQEILDRHERSHWQISAVDLRVDCEQWKNGKITPEGKAFFLTILRMFTQSDQNICGLYVDRLLPLFKNNEARMMLLSFASREVTHIRGYKLLNDTLGYDSEAFMSEFLQFKEMKDKHDFMLEDVRLKTSADVALYLAKQVLMEGVSLFGSFTMLLSYSQEGKFPGTVSVNQWSIEEESAHAEGLTELFKIVIEENPKIVNDKFKAQIYEFARQVVKLEEDFISLCYRTGKNTAAKEEDVKGYVRMICDYRMQQMGFKSQFNIEKNPLPWMDLITSNTLANFFEAPTVQYSKGSLIGDWVY